MKASKIFAILSVICCVVGVVGIILTFAAPEWFVEFYRNLACDFVRTDECIIEAIRKASIITAVVSAVLAIIFFIIFKCQANKEVAIPELQDEIVVKRESVKKVKKEKAVETRSEKAMKHAKRERLKSRGKDVVETAAPIVKQTDHNSSIADFLNSYRN